MVDVRAECDRMEKLHQVTKLAEIFQSDVDELGDGVCRGIVLHWIASNLDAIEVGNYEFVTTFRREVSELSGKKASKFIALHEDKKFHKLTSDLSYLSLYRKPGTIISYKEYSLGQFTFCFDTLFPHRGIYYVQLPEHCFGVKITKPATLFIDANSCEWYLPTNLARHKAFLVDYIATLYPEKIFDDISTIHFK